MTLSHSPSIVRDGLQLYLDAANSKSYPGSGTTWTDLSGNENNGVLENGPVYSSDNSGSIIFDGVNDIVNCGSSNTLNITSSLTINAWIFPTGFGEGNFGRIVDRANANAYALFLDNTGTFATNGIRYLVNNAAGTGSISNIVTLNTWQNFVLSHLGTSAILYKNGFSVGTINGQTLPSVPNQPLYIGNRNALDRTFQGSISQVSIYNKALTANEIKQNFNALRGRYGL